MRQVSGPAGKAWMVLRYVALAAFCLVWIYPFLWLLSASLKTPMEIFAKGLNLMPDAPVWENYSRAWITAGFQGYMINTLIVTIGTVAVVIFHTALTGYVLGRYEFAGRKLIIGILGATFVVPAGLTIIPIVDLASTLGLMNGPWGIILALAGSGQSAAILLYAGYFRSLPKELEEAATMDGANFLNVFFNIMLPLAGPVTATVGVLTFLAAWNAFLIPLVFTFSAPELRTLPVGMLAFVGTNETDWSGMAAAATISLVPVIAFFFVVQRYFVEGISGAVKA
ncbi:MAG TPA: carbohydrate ABC transporter permease [Devosia sp.]|nr:carbohydrate ABC transporter permease [Devosia sp.]